MTARQQVLNERFGSITAFEGDWKSIPPYMGIQTNQTRFNAAAAGYGVANIEADPRDSIVRRQPRNNFV